jgi:DNA-binding HxlR family transcriptional regulator
MTVKDIAQTIKDCSAKTIQRELNALIKAKVIDKTGQRRWTLYFVN